MAGRPDKPPELTELLVAAVLLGCLGGGVLGAVAGGVAWPPLGIGFGAVAGVQLGALLGVLNAIAMWALGRSALAPTVAGAVALLVSAGSAALVLLVPGRLDLASSSALVIAAGGLGLGLAPVGVRLATDPWWWRGPAGRRILRITARTAMVAAAVGGGVGLAVGLRVDALTAPFAVIEVGLPAAGLGLLLGAALGVGRVAAAGRRR